MGFQRYEYSSWTQEGNKNLWTFCFSGRWELLYVFLFYSAFCLDSAWCSIRWLRVDTSCIITIRTYVVCWNQQWYCSFLQIPFVGAWWMARTPNTRWCHFKGNIIFCGILLVDWYSFFSMHIWKRSSKMKTLIIIIKKSCIDVSSISRKKVKTSEWCSEI